MSTRPALPLLHRPGPLGGLVRVFSSIRLGIALLALIIVYSSIGSAVPPFRQWFELTEFAWFNHRVFVALIALFCVALTAATVVRIPFNRFNAGVITVHSGLLILAAGSVLYFGRKIEGDVLLWNPRVQILSAQRLHGGGGADAVIGQFVAAPGRTWEAHMPMVGGRFRFEVQDVRHDGLLTAAEVHIRAETGDSTEPRTITLKQDELRNTFTKLNDQLFLQLLPTNVTDRFYDNQTPALLVRRRVASAVRADGAEPVLFSLEGLPLYHERFVAGIEEIRDTRGQPVRSARLDPIPGIDAWSLPLPVGRADQAELHDWPFRMEIDGYLPYASLSHNPRPGGTELNPIARIELADGDHQHADWLVGRVPRDSMLSIPGHVSVEFRWLGEQSDLPQDWTCPLAGTHVLDVWVKDRDIRRQYDVSPGQTIKIEGTDYELTIQDLQPDWPLATSGFEGARSPVARVWVKTPQRAFQRSVLQRYPELNQDRDEAGQKLSETGLVDDNLELRYFDASAPHFLVAAAQDLAPVVVYTAPGGKRSVDTLEPGRRFETQPGGAALTLRELILRPRMEARPVVIPVEQRRPGMGRQVSLVRLRVTSTRSDWEQRVWIPFEPYNDSVIDHAPQWVRVDVPDFGPVDLLYGRLPRPLPGRLALEQMHVDFYPGQTRPREWMSYIRWEDPRTRTVTRGRAYLNNTARIGPWTLFQSSAANDHDSFTVLGVGNRDGVMTMLLGCTLITLGMVYAFYVKPVLKRRARQRLAEATRREPDAPQREPAASPARKLAGAAVGPGLALAVALSWATTAAAQQPAHPVGNAALEGLRKIQPELRLDPLRTLLVQHNSRYQTLEAWARDIVGSVHGSAEFMGLDPVAAAFELMFNREAYDDLPVIYVKDVAVRKNITGHPVDIDAAEAARIVRTGMVSYSFLNRPAVAAIVRELSSNMILKRAMDRYSIAAAYYPQVLGRFVVVPAPTGDYWSPWYGIDALFANLGMPEGHARMTNLAPVPGIPAETAAKILNDFRSFGRAWLARDAEGINRHAAALAKTLPTLAPPGVYPSLAQRRMEVFYHRMNAFTFGWGLYIAALFVSIWALVAGWSWTRRLAIAFYLVALLLHAAGLAMRWYIVGRIPVANMFEAVVSSAWVGVALALVLELATKRRVFVLAGSFLGFLSLVLGKFVGAEITQIAPILDDVMLRIHTVLIIASYAIITLAFGVAVCYLVAASRGPQPYVARVTLGIVAALGLCAWLATRSAFHNLTDVSGWFIIIIPVVFAATGALLFAFGPELLPRPALAPAIPSGPPGAAGIVSAAAVRAAPRAHENLLAAFDLSHMILLHMATITLFVGLVLGAIWADYSWGRPWGWDPKEVFALVTWLFYAILIHVRVIAKRRTLWTAVMSCVGFAAMQFNWWVVNFYIVGLHSYA